MCAWFSFAIFMFKKKNRTIRKKKKAEKHGKNRMMYQYHNEDYFHVWRSVQPLYVSFQFNLLESMKHTIWKMMAMIIYILRSVLFFSLFFTLFALHSVVYVGLSFFVSCVSCYYNQFYFVLYFFFSYFQSLWKSFQLREFVRLFFTSSHSFAYIHGSLTL